MELLHVSANQLYHLVSTGKLPAYKPAGRLLFKRTEIEAHVENSRVKPTVTVYHKKQKRLKRPVQKYVPGQKWV